MRNLQATERSMAEGGTELACMSTSTSKEIVGWFAKSEHPLVFKIVSSNYLSDGADIAWISMYPTEAEILYPPLTYLQVKPGTGKTPIKGTAGYVIEVEPVFL